MNWTSTDQPIGSALASIQAGTSPAIVQQQAALSSALLKPLPTGGVAGITFSNTYTYTNLASARINPSYQPILQFQFEQPLLQLFGTEINQIHASHPGSILTPGINALGTLSPQAEGILLTRIRFDQQRAEFERAVMIQASNVEIAYWNLYYAYWNLYAQEQGLRLGFVAWNVANALLNAGKAATWPRPATSTKASAPPASTLWARSFGWSASCARCWACTPRTATGWCPPTRRRWPRTSPTGTRRCGKRCHCGRG